MDYPDLNFRSLHAVRPVPNCVKANLQEKQIRVCTGCQWLNLRGGIFTGFNTSNYASQRLVFKCYLMIGASQLPYLELIQARARVSLLISLVYGEICSYAIRLLKSFAV